MNLAAALMLGRVSNLPTVWTNVLAGMVLAGGSIADPQLVPLLAAFSLFYVAGMFLNDWFDRDFDARHRPERPIPAGEAAPGAVVIAAAGMLVAALALITIAGFGLGERTGAAGPVAGLALVAAIVIYNRWHKENPLSPVVMAACRALVYLGAGYAVVAGPDTDLHLGAGVLAVYLVGLTFVARRETLADLGSLWPLALLALALVGAAILAVGEAFAVGVLALLTAAVLWGLALLARRRDGDIPAAVIVFIAGISLLDATLIAGTGESGAALIAALGFPATLLAQRIAPGT